MASVTLQGYSYDYVYAICVLSNPFNTSNYYRIVVSTGETEDGSQNPPDNILWDEFPNSSSTSNFVKVVAWNLDSNTEYTLHYYAETLSRQYYLIGSFWIHTPYRPLEILSVEGIDNGTCILTATSSDNVDFDTQNNSEAFYLYGFNGESEFSYVFLDKEKNSDGTYNYYFYLGGSYSCAKNYDIYAYFDYLCEDDGKTYSSILSNTISFTPYPNDRLLWSISCLSISQNSNEITIKVKDQSEYLWSEYVFYIYKNDVLTDKLTVTTAGEYTFSGLESGENYKLIGTVFYNGNEAHSINPDGKTFDVYEIQRNYAITASRPGYFYWSEEEKNAFLGNGKTTVLTATRWNAFVDNINEVLKYKGLTSATLDSDLYGVESGTYMNDFIKQSKGESGEYITANRFNIARHSIGTMKSTGISTKYFGDKVIGSEFITLQDKLNEIT